MIKGIDYFACNEDEPCPVVLVPCRLVQTLSLEEAALAHGTDDPSNADNIFDLTCEGNELLKILPFEGSEILRLGHEGAPVYWIPAPLGPLAVAWGGANSEEHLLDFALGFPGGPPYDEEVIFEITDDFCYFSDIGEIVFGGDHGSEPCKAHLPAGRYLVTAKFAQGDDVSGIIYRFSRQA